MNSLSQKLRWAIRQIEEHGMRLEADTLRAWLPLAERMEANGNGRIPEGRPFCETPEGRRVISIKDIWPTPTGNTMAECIMEVQVWPLDELEVVVPEPA